MPLEPGPLPQDVGEHLPVVGGVQGAPGDEGLLDGEELVFQGSPHRHQPGLPVPGPPKILLGLPHEEVRGGELTEGAVLQPCESRQRFRPLPDLQDLQLFS